MPTRTRRFRRADAPGAEAAADAIEIIRLLASEIGPRRPCSEAEQRAAHALVAWLDQRGVSTDLQHFRGYSSFAHPYAAILSAVLAGGLVQRRGHAIGSALTTSALAALALEGDLRFTPVSNLLSRRPSVNVVASIPAHGDERARVCLCGHLDSTRSGLIFHPAVQKQLPLLLALPTASAVLVAVAPLLPSRWRPAHTIGTVGLVASLALLLERELRGRDVPGANDNASGTGVACQLFAQCAARPLEHTRVDLLITGCEESGLLGSQAYIRSDPERARRTTFVNFDTVGGDVPLTYVLREGAAVKRQASARLVAMLERIARDRPELGLRPSPATAGLPTDATPALARGFEAVTLLARGDTIPNYHWPTDTYENVEPNTVGRAVETGRELLRAIDAETA
jgi:Peptidase family M28